MSSKTIGERLVEWQQELLDLSNRNKLLNFRHAPSRPSSIRLLNPTAVDLYRQLVVEEKVVCIAGREPDPAEVEVFDAEVEPAVDDADIELSTIESGEALVASLDAALSDLPEDKTNRVLLRLAKQARSSELEQGVNTLYAAFGRLKWRERPEDEIWRSAPLVLLPIRIEPCAKRYEHRIAWTGDEPEFNQTLVQRMRKDFAIELAAPAGDELNLTAVFADVAAAVAKQPGWEVVTDVHVALFQFHKLRMFRDLSEHANVAIEHPIVRALGEEDFLDSSPDLIPPIEELDRIVRPEQTYTVLDADGSQLCAVQAAVRGANLIINGPPGTGKSQTIANIIAECIAAGKTVLFVSEKTAAIEVVYRRLANVGLGDYCLMLHSQKANKREVIAELGHQLDRHLWPGGGRPVHDAQRLAERRDQLNAYADALHRVRDTFGRTVFAVFGDFEAVRDCPQLEVEPPPVGALTPAVFDDWRDRIRRAERWRHVLRDGNAHPWSGLTRTSITLAEREALQRAVGHLRASANGIEVIATEITAWLSLPEVRSAREARGQLAVLRAVPRDLGLMQQWLDPVRLDALAPIADEAHLRAERTAQALEKLSRDYQASLVELVDEELQRSYDSGLFGRLFSGTVKRHRTQVRALAVGDEKRSFEDERTAVRLAAEIRADRDWFAANGALLADLGLNPAGPIRPDATGAAVRGLAAARAMIGQVGRECVPAGFAAAVSRADTGEQAESLAERLRVLLDEFDTAHATLTTFLSPGALTIDGADLEAARLGGVAAWANGKAARFGDIEGWLSAKEALVACKEAELDAVVAALLLTDGADGAWDPTFRRLVLAHWLSLQLDADPVLRRFSAVEHEAAIAEFRALDQAWVRGSSHRLRAKLATETAGIGTSATGEPGLLRREANKKRAHLPLRRLFREIPNLLPMLKPCLMMSPLSVASYLQANRFAFDVVLFDEASQVRPHDAVGAIMRGKQLIVAGDENQLPPTSFFDRVSSDDDEGDDSGQDIRTYESILKALQGRGMVSRPLLWHYRSRHEHLIAFSNRHIYGDQLITFPSPNSEREPLRGVHFVDVPDGVYQDERDAVLKTPFKVNRREAQRVAQLVMQHARARPHESLGVVALGVRQRDVIDEEVERARSLDRAVDDFFDPTRAEPFFVKALEEVQGDERDVIVISVGYGKDATGKLSHNFGPINHEGGHRRLNVLVTRAKNQVIVVSSIKAGDIEDGRYSRLGPALLKRYLDFAERGIDALELEIPGSLGGEESPFEEQVAAALRSLGYRVETQVGCSKFRIDLAIVDPRQPGRYLLGIECDGSTYHSSKTARDRDRLRQLILEGHGWTIHRIWSTEWMRDRQRELDRVRSRIAELLASEPIKPPIPDEPIPHLENAASLVAVPATALQIDPGIPPYAPTEIRGSGDILGNSFAPLVNDIVRCVGQEGPVHVELVKRRIAQGWGYQRAGARIAGRIDQAITFAAGKGQIERRGNFLWLPKQVASLRGPASDGSVRDIAHVPGEEILLAFGYAIDRSLSLSADELVAQSARVLGYQRTGTEIQHRLRAMLALAEANKLLELQNDRYRRPG